MTLSSDLSRSKNVRKQEWGRYGTFWSLLQVNRTVLVDGRTDGQN